MISFESVIVDFPKDVAAALEKRSSWVWSESYDGKTAKLAKDGVWPNTAKAEAWDKDGSLILAATWELADGSASLRALEGKLASACASGSGFDEQSVLSVFAAASLGCAKFEGPSLASRAAERVRRILGKVF